MALAVLTLAGCRMQKDRPVYEGAKKSPVEDSATNPKTTTLAPPFTAENNPTARAGRGEPSLEDHARPAAWIFIDGREGRFTEVEGRPLLQWIIEEPVRSNPTFRVEVYEPLLGKPTDFFSALQRSESGDAVGLIYAIRSQEGTFETGREYSLLAPGPNFIVLDRLTNETLSAIPPLAPGNYVLAAGVRNRETGSEGLAVTYFTVGSAEGHEPK